MDRMRTWSDRKRARSRRGWLALGALVALGLLPLPAGAQTAYQIEAQDELKIEVWEKPDYARTVIVRADGTVTLPLIGEVLVAGTTPAKLEEELARKFSLYDRQITQVSVGVSAYNSKAVFVLGEVATPGKYARWPMPTIWDLIREAGGPTEDAYLGGVQVIRKGAKAGERNIQTVDLNQIWGRGVPSDLPPLLPDDTVIVPKKVVEQTWPNVIYVLGAVKTPGVYQKEAAVDLVGAILLAGGPTNRANLEEVTIVRRAATSSQTIEINVNHYLKNGEDTSNPVLVAGDTITVDESREGLVSFTTIRNLAVLTGFLASMVLLVNELQE
jgi:polysaccharide export outer membrane protein